jgi:maltoporin
VWRRATSLASIVALTGLAVVLQERPAQAQGEAGAVQVGTPMPPPPMTAPKDAPKEGEPAPADKPKDGTKEPGKDGAPAADGTYPQGKFEFGSYGRVRVASDLRGGTGRPANIVSHGARFDETDYAELELRREDKITADVDSKVVATMALFGPFFHFTGKPTDNIGVRNLYAQARYKDVTLWAGARMYRGDDIYVLDYWPLDNQNTVGGGVGAKVYETKAENGTAYETRVQAHFGMNRLDDTYQYQKLSVVAPFGFGTTDITKLDRPRMVETLKLTELVKSGKDKSGFKVILYGEAQELSAGVYTDTNTHVEQALPSETGFLVGSELAYFTGERDTYVALFLKHARGIAAYDPLSVPLTFAADRSVGNATESLIALGGNYERGAFGLVGGAYFRAFRDASATQTGTQKYDEGAVVLRPQAYISDHFGVALDASYQARRTAIVDPSTDGALTASVVRTALMPYFSPWGRGSFKRPQLYAIYAATFRDSGARALYAPEDAFAQRKVEHFAGIGAEWWFNSSSYP